MISAYTMTVYVQPDLRACASAILDLLLRWPPTPPAQTTVTPVTLPQDGAVAACEQLPPNPQPGAALGPCAGFAACRVRHAPPPAQGP
jgi:hypothetical protein